MAQATDRSADFLQMVRFLDGLLKMTYDLWQPSLSGLGMAQCYGTGYVVRKAAIDSIGGWSTFTPIAEVYCLEQSLA